MCDEIQVAELMNLIRYNLYLLEDANTILPFHCITLDSFKIIRTANRYLHTDLASGVQLELGCIVSQPLYTLQCQENLASNRCTSWFCPRSRHKRISDVPAIPISSQKTISELIWRHLSQPENEVVRCCQKFSWTKSP